MTERLGGKAAPIVPERLGGKAAPIATERPRGKAAPIATERLGGKAAPIVPERLGGKAAPIATEALRGPAQNRRPPGAGQARGLALAVLLSGLAGMVDAVGFLRLRHLFVSYMSGNSTQFAVALGRGELRAAGAILVLIALFVAGAASGQLLAHAAGRRRLAAVLAAVTALLAAAAVLDTAPVPMVLAMGALNAALHRAGNLPISLTFVTGTLVRFGQGLGDLLAGRADGRGWAVQALPWLGLVTGAALAGAVHLRIGASVAWLPVGAAFLLLLWSRAIPPPE